ncbi:phosphoenolpyruvate-protein phosphotransferase [Elusimicrobium simillimum]|uniref:phosphoenolpyruvate--protein phosphotransferase n=1 Tax=Elusimicrobium simillimum TaxID=3143438 RepID=UPI003C6F6E27
MNLEIFAPVTGKVTPIEQVPDPAFSEKMLGDGIAIDPEAGVIVAPFDGTISSLNENLHAISVTSAGGAEILIHIGVETVALKGKGFKAFVKQGDTVKKGDKMLEVDFDFIGANAPSKLVIVIVTNPMETEVHKTTAATVEAGRDFILNIGERRQAAEDSSGPEIISTPVKIINKNGIHARPAGVMASIANKFSSKIEIAKGDKKASAKSIVSIMGLGLGYEDTITIHAAGQDAEDAIKALMSAIKEGLNETEEDHAAPAPQAAAQNDGADLTKEAKLGGISASAGFVTGKAVLIKEEELAIPATNQGPAKEAEILNAAINKVKEDIKAELAAAGGKQSFEEILKTHMGILEDHYLLDSAKSFISSGQNAAQAFVSAVSKSVEILSAAQNALIKERVADYKDLQKRVVMAVTGAKPKALNIAPGSILVAQEFLPNDISKLDSNVAGVISAAGSATSHASIMLRNAGVPALVNVGDVVLGIKGGEDIVLNATDAYAVFNPSDSVKKEAAAQVEKNKKASEENLLNAGKEAKTTDGVLIAVEGNVGSLEETEKAAKSGADGLGLIRTEFIFAAYKTVPTEEEQFKAYNDILTAMNGKPVTFRTFDVGGDKPVAYMNIPHEENPIMGLRGVRNYEANKELITNQIRALLRLKPQSNVRIMIPMISSARELDYMISVFEQEKKNLNMTENYNLGIMVEIPSVAILADRFIKHVNFFSIGTNDLTQYTVAIDRGNAQLAKYSSSFNPAVLTLINMTANAANKAGKKAGVCGGMASQVNAVALLIGLGVRELAVSAPEIANIKALIRTLSVSECEAFAREAMSLRSSVNVRELVKQKYNL